VAILVLIAANLTIFAGVAQQFGVFQQFRARTSDGLFPRGDRDRRVVVVGIDEKALEGKREGLSRSDYAAATNRLFDAGAAVVAFDVVFDAPGQGDDAFAAAMRRGKVVLAIQGNLDAPSRERGPRRLRDGALQVPTPVLGDAATAEGLANVLPDPDDGVVRSIPLFAETAEADVPSLALATLLVATDNLQPITQRPFGIQVGTTVIPSEAQQTLRVSYAPGLAPITPAPSADGSPPPANLDPEREISFADVLDGKLPKDSLRGSIVMIGATSRLSGDFRLTPTEKANLGMPGAYIHANALNTMLTKAYIRDASRQEDLAWVFALSLAIAALSLAASWRVSVPVPIVLGIAYFEWVNARANAGVVLDLVYPLVSMTLALLLGLGLRYITEGRQRRRVQALFAQYIPPEIAQKLVDEDRVQAAAEGERVEISVLFCDLRGFTAASASMEPAQVRAMLEVYYEPLTQLILDNEGTLMQYVGDEIFAIFGAPLPDPDHADKALRCAMAMQDLRPALGEQLAGDDLPPVFYGIGLNAGTVVAAHIGSTHRKQYSVIGDTVNIGARLCSQARDDQICFPESFRERITSDLPPLDDQGPIEFKNATRPIQVWRYWSPHSRPDSRPERDAEPKPRAAKASRAAKSTA
jgi:adenylate cyclase